MDLNRVPHTAHPPGPVPEARPGHCTQCGKPTRAQKAQNAEPAGSPAPLTAPRTHFAAYTAAYTLQLPAKKGAVAPLPLRQQRMAGGFCCGSTGSHAAVVPAEGYYICLWEAGITKAEGTAALELGINDNGSILTECLEEGYFSGQQYAWFQRGDLLTLRLRNGSEAEALTEGSSAQLTLIRIG